MTTALTPREREALGHAADGLANKEIAAAMGVSLNAAKRHLCSVNLKLGTGDRLSACVAVGLLERTTAARAGNPGAPPPVAGEDRTPARAADSTMPLLLLALAFLAGWAAGGLGRGWRLAQ